MVVVAVVVVAFVAAVEPAAVVALTVPPKWAQINTTSRPLLPPLPPLPLPLTHRWPPQTQPTPTTLQLRAPFLAAVAFLEVDVVVVAVVALIVTLVANPRSLKSSFPLLVFHTPQQPRRLSRRSKPQPP